VHLLTQIAKAFLVLALVAFFVWMKWQQAKRGFDRDLGDGGLQTLFGSEKEAPSRPAREKHWAFTITLRTGLRKPRR
jgi:hypothetical protein